MWPRWTLVSDSRWLGVRPAHEHRRRASGKPTDVADLGDHDRGGDAAHAVEGLDCVVALVVSETAVELVFDHVQFILVALEQTAE